MKRVSITRGFLAIIVIAAIMLGAFFAFILINPNVLGLISSGNQVTISSEDYEELMSRYSKYNKAEGIWRELEANFYKDFDESKLEDAMITGLVSGLGDRYSTYYSSDEYESIEGSLTGEYSGVGMTMVASDEYIEVLKVTKNSPADKGGVTIGEYIIAVDGINYGAEDMDVCAAEIRGEEGSSVNVTFLKDGQRIERTFVREKVLVDSVEYKVLDDNIGYIWLYGFEKGSYDDFLEAMTQLKGCDSLILDLRDNPGGIVDTAEQIADLFLDKATLFYTEDRQGDRRYWYSNNGTLWDKPLVLIVNGNSASASEILAVALKDNDRVKIVGTQSFGKGVIQQMEQFKDGSALKLTMWQYFSPNGNPINDIGVSPDYEVELTDDCYDEAGYLVNDVQLNRAIELLK